MFPHAGKLSLLWLAALCLLPRTVRGDLYTLTAFGTISFNSSGDETIPIGTPWAFELTYDTAAPDRDFEVTGAPDPTFGRFTNAGAPRALRFFHYQAGDYQVTIDDPADFGSFSELHITFTSVNAIDINIHSPANFPPLAGQPVSFHADFNAFTMAPIFSSDALPTNLDLGPASFDQSTIALLPMDGVVSGSVLDGLTLTAVTEVPGDTNLDGAVDLTDLSNVRNHFGAAGFGDADGDSDVDLDDLNAVRNHFGAAETHPVPEPSSVALMGLGAMGAIVARHGFRRR